MAAAIPRHTVEKLHFVNQHAPAAFDERGSKTIALPVKHQVT